MLLISFIKMKLITDTIVDPLSDNTTEFFLLEGDDIDFTEKEFFTRS